jgi:hypothetical protein
MQGCIDCFHRFQRRAAGLDDLAHIVRDRLAWPNKRRGIDTVVRRYWSERCTGDFRRQLRQFRRQVECRRLSKTVDPRAYDELDLLDRLRKGYLGRAVAEEVVAVGAPPGQDGCRSSRRSAADPPASPPASAAVIAVRLRCGRCIW